MYSANEMPHQFCSAWNARDAKRLAGLFVQDAEFVNVTGLWWHNREAIFKAHDYGLKVIFPDSRLFVIRDIVKILCENVAVVHAKMKLTGQSAHQGKEAHERRTIFTFVMQRKSGKWLCVAAQNTDIVPGKETHLADKKGNVSAVDYR